jgi:hypothetical protein
MRFAIPPYARQRRSLDEAQRNPGSAKVAVAVPGYVALHPGYLLLLPDAGYWLMQFSRRRAAEDAAIAVTPRQHAAGAPREVGSKLVEYRQGFMGLQLESEVSAFFDLDLHFGEYFQMVRHSHTSDSVRRSGFRRQTG